jgi:hypothetical protein
VNRQEIKTAERLLAPYVERTETAILDSGGQCLTAHWVGGGQRLFYTLAAVQAWVASRVHA